MGSERELSAGDAPGALRRGDTSAVAVEGAYRGDTAHIRHKARIGSDIGAVVGPIEVTRD